MATGGGDASGLFLDPRHFMFALICQLCEYKANFLQAMRAHFPACQRQHGKQTNVLCGHCGKAMTCWPTMVKHINVKGMERAKPCDPAYEFEGSIAPVTFPLPTRVLRSSALQAISSQIVRPGSYHDLNSASEAQIEALREEARRLRHPSPGDSPGGGEPDILMVAMQEISPPEEPLDPPAESAEVEQLASPQLEVSVVRSDLSAALEGSIIELHAHGGSPVAESVSLGAPVEPEPTVSVPRVDLELEQAREAETSATPELELLPPQPEDATQALAGDLIWFDTDEQAQPETSSAHADSSIPDLFPREESDILLVPVAIKPSSPEVVTVSSSDSDSGLTPTNELARLRKRNRELTRQNRDYLRQLINVSEELAFVGRDADGPPTESERLAREKLICSGAWPKRLKSHVSKSAGEFGDILAVAYDTFLHSLPPE